MNIASTFNVKTLSYDTHHSVVGRKGDLWSAYSENTLTVYKADDRYCSIRDGDRVADLCVGFGQSEEGQAELIVTNPSHGYESRIAVPIEGLCLNSRLQGETTLASTQDRINRVEVLPTQIAIGYENDEGKYRGTTYQIQPDGTLMLFEPGSGAGG